MAKRLKSIFTDDMDHCMFTGTAPVERHHVFGGSNRKKSEKYHFIFQPQSRANDLREFLFSNGFTINKELAVCEGSRYYIALDANYTGEIKEFTLSDCFIGKLPRTLEAKAYLKKQLDRYERRYNALKRKGENVDELEILINDLKGFVYG